MPLLTNRVGALKARFSLFFSFFLWANGGGGCIPPPGYATDCIYM